MNETIKAQISAIRDSGTTNMFDVRRVQQEAARLEYTELEDYLKGHKSEYSSFILTGEE